MKRQRSGTLVTWQDKKTKKHHWHLVASNGRITCSGEPNGYSSRVARDKGIAVVQAAFRTGLYNEVERV